MKKLYKILTGVLLLAVSSSPAMAKKFSNETFNQLKHELWFQVKGHKQLDSKQTGLVLKAQESDNLVESKPLPEELVVVLEKAELI